MGFCMYIQGPKGAFILLNTGVMNLAPALAVVIIISDNPKVSMHVKKLLSKVGLTSPD